MRSRGFIPWAPDLRRCRTGTDGYAWPITARHGQASTTSGTCVTFAPVRRSQPGLPGSLGSIDSTSPPVPICTARPVNPRRRRRSASAARSAVRPEHQHARPGPADHRREALPSQGRHQLVRRGMAGRGTPGAASPGWPRPAGPGSPASAWTSSAARPAFAAASACGTEAGSSVAGAWSSTSARRRRTSQRRRRPGGPAICTTPQLVPDPRTRARSRRRWPPRHCRDGPRSRWRAAAARPDPAPTRRARGRPAVPPRWPPRTSPARGRAGWCCAPAAAGRGPGRPRSPRPARASGRSDASRRAASPRRPRP